MFWTVSLSVIRSLALYTHQYIQVMLCPKHVESYSKNKFGILVHLIGFIIRSETVLTLQGDIVRIILGAKPITPCGISFKKLEI